MAGGMFPKTEVDKRFEHRVTVYLISSCFMAAIAGFLFGYDLAVTGGVTAMDDFQKKFFPSVYRKQKEARLAGFVTSIFAGYVTRKYGRRLTLIAGGLNFSIGAVLNGAATNLAMLVIGRLFLGMGVGLSAQAAPVYIAEMAPAKIRGALVNSFQFSLTVGFFASSLLNYFANKIHPYGWRIALGVQSLPAVMLSLSAFFLPDTPILEKVRGLKNVDAEFQNILEASRVAATVNNSFKCLLRRENRAQLLIACFLPGAQPFSGNAAIAFYVPVLFRIMGYGSSAALYSATIVGSVRMVGSAISLLLVDRLGRKALFFEGSIQMSLCQILQLALGTIFYLELGLHNTLDKSLAIGVVVLVNLWTAGFGWSWGPLIWVVPSEIFSLECRSAGMGLAMSFNYLVTLLLTQVFLTMFCHLRWGTFFFFAGTLLIMLSFTIFLLPETKGVPLEDMKHICSRHWYWKKFVPREDHFTVVLTLPHAFKVSTHSTNSELNKINDNNSHVD
ncbi:MFS transporter, SP family, sugar:H+ symporter [Marchantia polymorpha subsp. ruderalis]|uniref:Major facilitator superfamily (MFS) profile domain-containing protein n=2 Tax=Marchantia polymorpha TaxID=3197 RepID=A0AAF6B2J1_MARPO|nr:hypothetical protein MARPO_0049s0097 [Marchantia polymorpha]BBN06225.1 hypothetical protein Mp_3g19370 [Marchantia polymorpha subsp. ruderalis]|eukprot:PTQ38818.1 hypothetical protein MARPO_0049s0097 [Marchantia polymorpha]